MTPIVHNIILFVNLLLTLFLSVIVDSFSLLFTFNSFIIIVCQPSFKVCKELIMRSRPTVIPFECLDQVAADLARDHGQQLAKDGSGPLDVYVPFSLTATPNVFTELGHLIFTDERHWTLNG